MHFSLKQDSIVSLIVCLNFSGSETILALKFNLDSPLPNLDPLTPPIVNSLPIREIFVWLLAFVIATFACAMSEGVYFDARLFSIFIELSLIHI